MDQTITRHGRCIATALSLVAIVLLPSLFPARAAQPTTASSEPSTSAHTNRLAREKSPYLLQHAHNPVDWYPWGDEAFAKAKKENKPIFLSVGYSTCHWCHVMERESFENESVARVLNESFVAIKVDREERPDVDRVYMAFVQATTGSGGWPMTVFLTPDLKPFFGGSYFPPDDTDQMVGLKKLLSRAHEAWTRDHDKVVQSADDVAKAMKDFAAGDADRHPSTLPVAEPAMKAAFEQYRKSFDQTHGGFGTAPKFPEPVALNFLLHDWRRSQTVEARDMVEGTLSGMAAGGIYDHLAGGFHRYSTDERWFLPHFEKMLYDQAQLASIYLDAWQATRKPLYADVVRGTLDYVLHDLTGESGQFYSAEDADSATDSKLRNEKHEGAFYVWTADEIGALLGADAAMFEFHYGVQPTGNVARDPRQEFPGRSVLFVAHTLSETATKFGKPPADVEKLLTSSRQKLLTARNQRPRPHRDDKTLAAWNGLTIGALARAGGALQEPRYTDAAVRAATFIRDHLYDSKTHVLTRRFRDGQADVPGFLDDYSFLAQGLIDLYENTLDIQWLIFALELQAKQDELFWDDKAGGYFSTPAGDASLFVRMKEETDGAEPAANSIAALNLLRLSQMTDDKAMRTKADRTLAVYSGRIDRFPTALPQMLVAADFRLTKPTQIVLAGNPASPGIRAMLREVQGRYMPNKVILCADAGDGQHFLAERLGFLKDLSPIGGRATAYVCENYACQLPVNELAAFAKQLK